jgi:hypothetical protein
MSNRNQTKFNYGGVIVDFNGHLTPIPKEAIDTWKIFPSAGVNFKRTHELRPGALISIPDNKKIRVCSVGIHSSKTLSEATNYHDRAYSIAECKVWGDVINSYDKIASRHCYISNLYSRPFIQCAMAICLLEHITGNKWEDNNTASFRDIIVQLKSKDMDDFQLSWFTQIFSCNLSVLIDKARFCEVLELLYNRVK